MSTVLFSKEGLSHDDALMHEDPHTSTMARMAVSDFAERMQAFINTELKRGTDPAILLITLARFQIQTHASLLGCLCRSTADLPSAQNYKKLLDLEYVKHAQLSREDFVREAP